MGVDRLEKDSSYDESCRVVVGASGNFVHGYASRRSLWNIG